MICGGPLAFLDFVNLVFLETLKYGFIKAYLFEQGGVTMRYNNIMRIFLISLFAIWIITVITLVTENRYLRKQNTELKLKIKD